MEEDEGKGVEVMAVAGMELGLNTGATEMMSLLEAGVEAEKVSSSRGWAASGYTMATSPPTAFQPGHFLVTG